MNPRAAALLVTLVPLPCFCQTAAATLPAGTPFSLAIDHSYPMRAGEDIRARLQYPVYADNRLVLPKDTVVEGRVVGLTPDHVRRAHAILGGDFTPFRTPEVRFDRIVLADGTSVPFPSDTATRGTAIYRAVTPPASHGGFAHQQFQSGLTAARADLATFIAPGKGDRLVQFIYSQIPYHPQRIEKGTSWTVEATAPIEVAAQPTAPEAPPTPLHNRHFWEVQPAPQTPAPESGTWVVQASLDDSINSGTSHDGQSIKAVVAEPIFNPDHTVAVPQGATLVGEVTRAKPARRFGRTGVLSFNFSQLILPNAETQTVETRLTGADSAQDIALNSEGQAKSRPQDKISIPLLLSLMASRPLDQDHHGEFDQTAKNGVGGAAGLGLVGTVVGLAGGSPYAAAGIGYWGAARAFFSRWIAPGKNISFPKDTRVVVEVTPRRSAPIKPIAR